MIATVIITSIIVKPPLAIDRRISASEKTGCAGGQERKEAGAGRSGPRSRLTRTRSDPRSRRTDRPSRGGPRQRRGVAHARGDAGARDARIRAAVGGRRQRSASHRPSPASVPLLSRSALRGREELRPSVRPPPERYHRPRTGSTPGLRATSRAWSKPGTAGPGRGRPRDLRGARQQRPGSRRVGMYVPNSAL